MAGKALACSTSVVMPVKVSLRPSSVGFSRRSVAVAPSSKSTSSAARLKLVVRAQQGGEQFGNVSGPIQKPVHTPWTSTEDDVEFKIRLDVPGLTADDVDVKVEGSTLVIKDMGRQLYSPYDTKVQLPFDCVKEETKAVLKNGVLHVSVPKRFARPVVRVPIVNVPVKISPA